MYFHVLVSALLQVLPPFNQGDIITGHKNILNHNKSGKQCTGAEGPWDWGHILRTFIYHAKDSELTT